MEEAGWLFELAVLLRTTVGRLLEEMPVNELMAWRKYILEPRGDRRDDWHAAMLAKSVHDIGLGFAGKLNDMPLEKYLLRFQTEDPQELLKRNMRNARALFGKVVPSC